MTGDFGDGKVLNKKYNFFEAVGKREAGGDDKPTFFYGAYDVNVRKKKTFQFIL
jgi:hypothetical protein